MAGLAGLLRQCPLLLPQNCERTVYEGFVTAQVPPAALTPRQLSPPLPFLRDRVCVREGAELPGL